MTDNTTAYGGDTIRDLDRLTAGIKTQVLQLDAGGPSTNAESLVMKGNGLPVAIDSTNFVFSVVNSTTAQLGSGATFTGTIESIINQQAISINLTSDQPLTLVINQYIDAGGTRLVSSWTYPIAAGMGFNRAWVGGGNYHNLVVTNNGTATTTTLNLSTAYGTLPAVTQLGNSPIAINELGGVAVVGSLPENVVGNPSGPWANVDLLEQVIDDGSGITFKVSIKNLKQDATGALTVSDAIPVALPAMPIGAKILIDTTGYASLGITTQGLAGNITATNDLTNFSALTGIPLVMGAFVTAVVANTGYSFPCLARWIVITVTTAGTASLYLRATPWIGAYTTGTVGTNNVNSLNGTAPVNAGVAGTLAVGGNIAVGVAPTLNPLNIGGADGSGLTRRLLTDNGGRPVVIGRGLNDLNNIPVVDVQETTQVEGFNFVELLSQILVELRISNFYASRHLAQMDEDIDPNSIRSDPSFLTN